LTPKISFNNHWQCGGFSGGRLTAQDQWVSAVDTLI
jgi:hypothetical protein